MSEQAVTEAQCRRICEVLGKNPDERVSDHGGLLQHAAAVERGETLYETFDILTITESWRLVRAAYVIAAPPAAETGEPWWRYPTHPNAEGCDCAECRERHAVCDAMGERTPSPARRIVSLAAQDGAEVLAAVRADCADRVRGLHGQHLTLNRDEVQGWELALTSALAALETKA